MPNTMAPNCDHRDSKQLEALGVVLGEELDALRNSLSAKRHTVLPNTEADADVVDIIGNYPQVGNLSNEIAKNISIWQNERHASARGSVSFGAFGSICTERARDTPHAKPYPDLS